MLKPKAQDKRLFIIIIGLSYVLYMNPFHFLNLHIQQALIVID